MKYTNAQIAKAIKNIIENAEMLDNALDVALRATEIEEQNKRYREALEEIATRKMSTFLNQSSMNEHFIQIANEALEEIK